MDQAKPQGEKLLWHFPKCSKNSDLDCYDCLPHFGDPEGKIWARKKPLTAITLFGGQSVREKAPG